MLTYNDLVKRVKSYSPDIDGELIKKAYLFALEQHATQIRESGDLYFNHPLAVAQILIELKMDQVSIASGLLHDTVEDTATTNSQIKELFGSEVSKIVNGVTKLSQFENTKIARRQVENFKKLLLSAASDIRVLIVKLADRLHNMRTLKFKKCKSRRAAIAQETIEIYAPLAERIGLQKLKDELQDVAFHELYPALYNTIREQLKNLYNSEDEIINTIREKLTETLNQLNIEYTINGRIKSIYSIWNKMNVRTISFDQLSDIMAFRIIVQDDKQCYQVLGLIHRTYLVVPGRFRDYISIPKSNGYQSLHTCIIGPLNKRIEIQIRTQAMHLTAEYGVAAHWEYKEKKGAKNSLYSNSQWLKNIAHILDSSSKMDDFVKIAKTEIFSENVYCITPKGELVQLPVGSSVLDFAYAIHTEVGNHAISANVNGQEVSLKTIVKNGDKISILTDENATPHSLWQSYVITTKAKVAIRLALESFESEHVETIGKNFFNDLLTSNNITLSNSDFNILINDLHYSSSRQFFFAIGNNELSVNEIIHKCEELFGFKLVFQSKLHGDCSGLTNKIVGLPNLPVVQTKCCSPIFGDKIFGIIQGGNIKIHYEECTAFKTDSLQGDAKILELYWKPNTTDDDNKYVARLQMFIIVQPGNLSKIANIFESHQIEILKLQVDDTKTNIKIYNTCITIEFTVNCLSKLNSIIFTLKELPFVGQIIRK